MSEILGHLPILKMLDLAIANPSHGYLFHGPDGVGKRLVARHFSSKLLASDFSPLTSHPDFVRLNREEGEKNIKVEAVRDLVNRMHLTSAVGGRKVALIEDAEAMNDQGMNALLKSVEEPDGQAIYLFITEQPDALPATLRSRLVSVAFAPLPIAEIKQWLGTNDQVAEASRGCPGVAKRILADMESWKDRRRKAEALLRSILSDTDGKQVGEIERLAKSLQSAEDPERAWKAFLTECEGLAATVLGHDPARLARFGEALIRARKSAGGAIPPAMALEWAVVETYHDGDVPSFLHPTYLL